MRHLLMVLGLTCAFALPLSAADNFYLVTKSGEKIGPIDFREGEMVKIGRQEFKIEKGVTEFERVKVVLEGIKIPSIDFKQADVREVVSFLNDAIRKHGTNEYSRVAPTCVIHLAPNIGHSTNATALPAATETNSSERSCVAPVTLSGLRISVWQALMMTTGGLGLHCLVRDNIIEVTDGESSVLPMIYRVYYVDPDISDRLPSDDQPSRQMETQGEIDLKAYYRSLGVDWPRGSSIRYMRSLGKLVVVNTADNLAKFERVLDTLKCIPNQLEVEVKFVSFSKDDIARASQTGMVSLAVLEELNRKGKGLLLADPQAITKSGSEVTVKGVVEYIYPTEFGASRSEVCTSNHVGSTNTCVPDDAPGAFETREVGAILQCLPELSTDGQTINLTLSPSFVFPPTWKDYSQVASDGKRHGQIPMEQPFFATTTVLTSVSIGNGQTTLLGGGVPDADGKRLVYTLLTARKVGLDGKPIASRKPLSESEPLP